MLLDLELSYRLCNAYTAHRTSRVEAVIHLDQRRL